MGAIKGSKVVVGMYSEATYKTPGASGTRLAYASIGLQPNQARDKSAILSGYYGESRGVLGNQAPAGPIASECGPETIGLFLKHLIGAPVSAAAGSAFKHTFTVGEGANDIPPGFTLEEDFGTALASATHRVLRYLGCRLNNGSFNFGTSGFIGVNFDVLGAKIEAASAPLDSSLTDLGHTSFGAANTSIVLSSGTEVVCNKRELSLNIKNDLDPDWFNIGGGGIRADAPRGMVGLDGSLTGLFDSDALLKQVLADTDCSLVVALTRGTGVGTAGNEKLQITIPALTFAPAAPQVNGPRGILLPTTFSAHRTTGEIGIKAELWNAQATIE
jgi:hypothetical protein